MVPQIVILDFGSQYTQLIARRVRECNVYCEIHPYNKIPNYINEIKGLILSGSPFSVNQTDAPKIDLNLFKDKFPILGICFGAQFGAKYFGGHVEKSENREYGKASLQIVESDVLFQNVESENQVWMSHADTILNLPESANLIAKSDHITNAAYKIINGKHPFYGLQFHPEVTHSLEGKKILENYLSICGCDRNWNSENFIDEKVEEIQQKVGSEKVILGISGGVDSSVAALLLNKAIGKNLTGIFVDNGLLRHNEFEEVLTSYAELGLNVIGIDAKKEFYDALNGVADPEKKRKTIGKIFIDVFEREANKLEGIEWLAQGTIYPDIIESISVKGPSATIKSHHNVGGLPDKLNLKILEPLKSLFKDEVRNIGKSLNLPNNILNRHPFPGPGLAIRILGEITEKKVSTLQQADNIYQTILKRTGWYDKIWQAGSILLPIKSVGVMGDERTYENVLALRAVNSKDGMTAEWTKIDPDVLAEISTTIINNVNGINRVVYDISTKPPSTIEWE